MIVSVPVVLGVNVMLHAAEDVVPLRLQLVIGLKVPAPLLVKPTGPVGVIGPAEVSVTVAVHDVAVFTVTEDGLQLTVVVVVSRVVPVERLMI